MSRIDELYEIFDVVNEEDFGGKLRRIKLLAKRNEHRDGFYIYRAHSDWTPIKTEIKRAVIVISDSCWDDEDDDEVEAEFVVEPALIHEMIHQYQAEIDGVAPHHDESFERWAKYFEEKYGYDVR